MAVIFPAASSARNRGRNVLEYWKVSGENIHDLSRRVEQGSKDFSDYKKLAEELGSDVVQRLAVLSILAEALRNENRLSHAVDTIRQGLDLAAAQPAEYWGCAMLYLELSRVDRCQGHLDESLNNVRRGIELIPEQIAQRRTLFWGQCHLDLGTALFELERYEEAVAAYGEVLKVLRDDSPTRRFALLCQGRAFLALGQEDNGKQSFAGLLRSPNVSDEEKTQVDVALVLHAAITRYEAGEYDDAARLFEDVLENQDPADPDVNNTLHWLANSYWGAENYEAAQRCYRKILGSPNATEDEKSSAKEALDELLG